MSISGVCSSYFSGFAEISNCRRNDYSISLLAALKILSYFTVLIPLSVYAVSLCGRVDNDPQDWKEAIAKRIPYHKVLSAYDPKFLPKLNQENLIEYSQSEDFKRHAKTAQIYYNSAQLTSDDALRIIFQREPTNIAMGLNQYNQAKLAQLFGYHTSVYNNPDAKKEDGALFSQMPNTAAVYAETYLWNPPGGTSKREIGCLSLPAPALDSSYQPHYNYYMSRGSLDVERYDEEIAFLFRCVEKAIRDNQKSAFKGRGFGRIVLSKFGQGAFLAALSDQDRLLAQASYRKQLAQFLSRVADLGIEVVMSEYQDPGKDAWHQNVIVGDIIQTAKDRDFIVNAWDPHSAPGNGNDADHSFDGAMGKGSGILLTQTAWLNPALAHQCQGCR